MSFPRLAVVCGLAALALSACGTTPKPAAGTPGLATAPGTRGKIDDPRTAHSNRIRCIVNAKLPVTPVGKTDLRIGLAPTDPRVHFEPTPGMAQGAQISGSAQGAEVIGGALLYPGQAPDSELKKIENCLSAGVTG
jgi:hypothetical protein